MDRRTFLLAAAFTASSLAGCSSESSKNNVPAGSAATAKAAKTATGTTEAAISDTPFSYADQIKELSTVQRNSVNMLNYLVVLMQQISVSKSSRLTLEQIYSDLINNISPDAVDSTTLYWINDILDGLEKYRMLTVKRERLQIIYEKAQAAAALEAIPDPLALLSLVNSKSLIDLAASVVYMAADSITSYKSAMNEAETEFMQGGWELDDEESEQLHKDRKETFTNTVETVTNYNLPGSLALTEETVEDFVSWQNEKLANRIRFFEKNAETYCALGEFWLLLARSYQKDGETEKCVRAIETYEELSTGILRKDHSYAKTLALALAAIMEANDGSFTERGEKWVGAMLSNCSEDDWALRYFAAQTYVALAGETGESKFVSMAYETALDNANELLPKQRSLNKAFLSPVEKLDGAGNMPWDDDEAKEKDSYNKMLESERKTALAPLYEPLILNLELLRAIVVDRPEAAQGSSLEEIIHSSGKLFLLDGLDERYVSPTQTHTPKSSGITYDCAELKVPAGLVTPSAKITSKVDGTKTAIKDWKLDSVERGSDSDASSFVAIYKSKTAKNVDYSDGSTVKLVIDPWPKRGLAKIKATFIASSTKTAPWQNLAVWDDGFEFKRV